MRRIRIAAVVVSVLAASLPATAAAADELTVGADAVPTDSSRLDRQGGIVIGIAGTPGPESITGFVTPDGQLLGFVATVPVAAEPPCFYTVPGDPRFVACPTVGVSGLAGAMYGGDDVLDIAELIGLPTLLFGNAGKDAIAGGGGRDFIRGGGGRDYLQGRSGRDFLVGGGGKDKLSGGPGKDKRRQ